MERYLYYCNQGETELHKEGVSQPSLNIETFHPTIQSKPPKNYIKPPKG